MIDYRKAMTAVAILGIAALGACNTTKGVGQDVKAAGAAVEGAAKDTQKEMTDGNPKTP
jgi:predicted small secreted protein